MRAPTIDAGGAGVLVAVAVAGFLLLRASRVVTDVTDNATNAAGQPVTAYADAASAGPVAGAVGALGAVANAASGGYLASAGQWIGGAIFDAEQTVRGWFTPADTAPIPARTTGDLARADRLADAWRAGP